ncbi:aldehyde dehydrogenase (NADP(+)) [Hyphococcus luteus]|uniref:Aldehyde dehydrogenase (NADP(+)) n=1 Tax=Hyphococcus luteus TaxID=2058213 RepID=A0A2S7KA78_9PROT|nr:aldehyde dehydrogenase (NADP(+)) [Marinicaulis flavus]PQA89405.1 aldehyde dehydrogenase (NADP(+)) [Marinicaulis flavus]
MTELTGEHFIGAKRRKSADKFYAANPALNEAIEPAISQATADDVECAAMAAADAAEAYERIGADRRAQFLDAISEHILGLGETLLQRAHEETGLPLARLEGERGRTVGQLKLMAAEARDGVWMSLRVDPALPDRKPAPRSDLRMRKKALGPVAIFGASNFPLAFSVAGGDAASALAAGCPIVVKAHPAHPGVSELIATAIIRAAEETGMPEGVFSLLQGNTHEAGQALVADPRIKAVGFTGSRQGGLALMKIAAARETPIPVYAEMSAINPVILLPGALKERAPDLGQAFVASLTLGAGQFCTNPGLVIALAGPELDAFAAAAEAAIDETAQQVMLTSSICESYKSGVEALTSQDGIAAHLPAPASARNCCAPALFRTTAARFAGNHALQKEVFGPASVIVACETHEEIAALLTKLEGQLTISIHCTEDDASRAAALLPLMEEKAGRIVANGWPTGVEVCHAMVHGGPFPATSDGRTTSVGTLSIERFVRPICYQDFPAQLLPPVLRDDMLPAAPHRHDGKWRF